MPPSSFLYNSSSRQHRRLQRYIKTISKQLVLLTKNLEKLRRNTTRLAEVQGDGLVELSTKHERLKEDMLAINNDVFLLRRKTESLGKNK